MREELIDQVVVAKFATTTQHGAIQGKTQTHQTQYYNLDVIISVGYRVKSQGDLPEKAQTLVIEWLNNNSSELQKMWETQTIKKLPPLV